MAAGGTPRIYSDDTSLVVLVLDTNPFFWSSSASSLQFANFLNHIVPFINSFLLVNQLNQVVVIATGIHSCSYIYDSGNNRGNAASLMTEILCGLEDFFVNDGKLAKDANIKVTEGGHVTSLLAGSLSLALCYIQRIFRSGARHPQPRILCLQGSPDGPEQYVAVMNTIFSAQRSMVPIDSCMLGGQNSAFLQQASHITGGVYLKPQQLDGLFEYLVAVFGSDLKTRSYLCLPKTAGVDFRASCFCHKKTIDMGYVCSVCLSIFCKQQKKCSTCGSEFSH